MKHSLRAAGLMALAVCAPAQAQLAPGISGTSSAPVAASEVEYWAMVRMLGSCLADSKSAKARALLASEPGSAEEDAAVGELFGRSSNNRCMGNFVRAGFSRAHLRGAIAEGLFEQLPDNQSQAAFAAGAEWSQPILSFHDFGACYVAAHPRQAAGLLKDTKLASRGELEYIQELAADFGECLPADSELRLSPIDIRMVFAEALYHAATRPVAQLAQGSQ